MELYRTGHLMLKKKKKQVAKKATKNPEDKFLDNYLLSGRDIEANKSIMSLAKGYSKKLTKTATESELKLKLFFDKNNLSYEFQKVIYIHSDYKIVKFYIADFYIPFSKLIIEVDGGYHNTYEQVMKDADRTRELIKAGYKVVRFNNEDVDYPSQIMLKINDVIKRRV